MRWIVVVVYRSSIARGMTSLALNLMAFRSHAPPYVP